MPAPFGFEVWVLSSLKYGFPLTLTSSFLLQDMHFDHGIDVGPGTGIASLCRMKGRLSPQSSKVSARSVSLLVNHDAAGNGLVPGSMEAISTKLPGSGSGSTSTAHEPDSMGSLPESS